MGVLTEGDVGGGDLDVEADETSGVVGGVCGGGVSVHTDMSVDGVEEGVGGAVFGGDNQEVIYLHATDEVVRKDPGVLKAGDGSTTTGDECLTHLFFK